MKESFQLIFGKAFLPKCELCGEKISWEKIRTRRGKSYHKKCFKDRK